MVVANIINWNLRKVKVFPGIEINLKNISNHLYDRDFSVLTILRKINL